jgi:filamentous hemagglutinin family protein
LAYLSNLIIRNVQRVNSPLNSRMNHIYRLVWSHRHSKLVVAHEKTLSNGHASSKASSSVASVLLTGLLVAPSAGAAPPTANTLPSGAQVAAGTAAISTSGSTMNVQQSTQRAAINWTDFSIGSNATVNFQQPNASAVVLNRVVGNEQSVITGALNANGQVFVLNSNGVLFGKGAQVNVGGLVASTLDLSDTDFMAGRTTFERNGSRASVINLGQITAADGGYVALLGNQVSNQGVISARLGTAALAAGDKISLNFNGNSLVGVTIDQGTLNALVENKQAVYADGGMVVLTANGVDTVLGSLVNNTGEIRAQTVANQEGKIYLLGDMENGTVKVDGGLNASAPNGGNSGFIETSAARVKVADSARVTTLANGGQSGTWLIDPNDFTVASSGGDMTGAAVNTALAGGNFTIQSTAGATSGNGNINVNDAVSWSANNTLTLNAYRNININADITASGATGKLALYYGQGAIAASNTADYNIAQNVKVNLQSGQNFTTKLGSDGAMVNYTVINAGNDAATATALQNMNNGLSGNYALGVDADLSSIPNWNPIGPINPFTGRFSGLGHSIFNLTTTGSPYAGLFGNIRSVILRDMQLKNVSVSAGYLAGGLLGQDWGSYTLGSLIENVHVLSGTVTTAANSTAGGLVGQLSANSTVRYSSSAASVSNGYAIGGLIGRVLGGTVEYSHASGSVQSSNNLGGTGGLLGLIAVDTDGANPIPTTVQYSYALGNVVNSSGIATGGLIGRNLGNNTISNVYAAGAVTGLSNGGGLFGSIGSGTPTITNAYWDTTTTGQATSAGTGTTGITNANAYTQSSYTGFDFTSTGAWFSVDGYTRPFLRSEWTPVISNAHQLQMMSSKLGASYTLANNIDLAPSLTNKSDMWKDRDASVNYSSYQGSWVPVGSTLVHVGNSTSWTLLSFGGSLDGQNHTIDHFNFQVDATTDMSYVGFFGSLGPGSTVRNLGLTNGSIAITGGTYGLANIGMLAGTSSATLVNDFATGTIASTTTNPSGGGIGGLVGGTAVGSGSVNNSHASVDVSAVGSMYVGGLIGQSNSAVTNSYATGPVLGYGTVGGLIGLENSGAVSRSYATGNVSASSADNGGLIGVTNGPVSDSYATGNVTLVSGAASTEYATVGGLIGTLGANAATVTNSYATGLVQANQPGMAQATPSDFYNNSYGYVLGALVGADWGNQTTVVTNSFYNSTVNPTLPGIAFNYDHSVEPTIAYVMNHSVSGKTTAEMQSMATFSSTSPAWNIVADSSLSSVYPQLRWATNGLGAGTSVWVMAQSPVTYTITGGSRNYGQAFTLPTPTYAGGTPTGTSTVKVYDASNSDVTSQAVAGTLPVGSYTVKDTLSDTNYFIASSGNTNGSLVVGQAPVTYAVAGGSRNYGQAFTLPTPTYAGGTPTGTSTVKVYDASNSDVTSQAVAGTLPVGTYTIKDVLNDTNYQIASSGNTIGSLVISQAPVTYTVTGGNTTTGQAFTLPTPIYTGGTPTGTSSVKVYDASNSGVTSQAVAGTLPVGTYTIKDVLNDTNYQIANIGNTYGTLVVTTPSGGGSGSSGGSSGSQSQMNDIDRQIASAIRSSSSLVPPQVVLRKPDDKGNANPAYGSVVNPPSAIANVFGSDTPLAVLSSPSANEPTQTVSLTDVKNMLNSSGTSGASADGVGDVRVPVSRNSLAEIVNGGVKLPTGVEQQLFVVKAN